MGSIVQMAPRKCEDITPKHEQIEKKVNDDEEIENDRDAEHENEDEHDADAEDHELDEEEVEEEMFYSTPLNAQMILWHGRRAQKHPLIHFVERARKILRTQPQITIIGRSNTIARACAVVDTLTRDKIGVLEKVSTDIQSDPFFTAEGNVKWTPPTPTIIFRVNQGEFAQTLSEYQQIKLSEIFEKFDPEITGFVSFEVVENMKLAEKFHAIDEHIEEAKAFLAEMEEERLDLPGFLRYAQRLISPMLKDRIFKRVLTEQFDVDSAVNKSYRALSQRQYTHDN